MPLSIIIVGIGEGPFGSMDELDSDNQMLSAKQDKIRGGERDFMINILEIIVASKHPKP